MTPNYMSSTQNPAFLAGSSTIENHDQHFHHQFYSPSFHHQLDASSSSHHSFHFYFNPTQHQDGYNYHTELVTQPQHQFDKFQGINGSNVAFDGSYDYSHPLENKVGKGLKISLGCKKEGKHEIVGDQEVNNNDVGKNSSPKLKVKMMHNKMKKSDHNKGGGEREDSQKIPFNNNNDHVSSNCSLYNNSNITPVRVCSDCNTTKTPLWRSGPKGPKSLCNACGIRQRKARRALAEAAAADAPANGPPLLSSTTETTPSPPPPSLPTTTTKVKIKANPQKEKSSKNNYNELSTVPFKKRCRVTTTTDNNASSAAGSSSSDEETPAPVNGFEDFLINIKNKLGFQHVFPQDEKEAAILLMALSCGLVHG